MDDLKTEEPEPMTHVAYFDQLQQQSRDLFKQTHEYSEYLQQRVDALEREIAIAKAGAGSRDGELAAALRRAQEAEAAMGTFKSTDPIVVCLIDGDGAIFEKSLLARGKEGGREIFIKMVGALQAAALLMKHINAAAQKNLGRTVQIVAQCFVHRFGLGGVLANNQICSTKTFDEFLIGFTSSCGLFSVIDVGPGKEAADAKIRESLRLWSHIPAVKKVYFAGSHDGGYAPVLTQLNTEGILHKIILLKSYDQLAGPLRDLNVDIDRCEGLFMANKLNASWKSMVRPNTANPPVPLVTNGKTKASAPSVASSTRSETPVERIIAFQKPAEVKMAVPRLPGDGRVKGGKKIPEGANLSKQKPPPCNQFYLLKKCGHGARCNYGHDYDLSQAQFVQLTADAKKTPCPKADKDLVCKNPHCIQGHVCPQGVKCKFLKAGTCKFSGKYCHTIPEANPLRHAAFGTPVVEPTSSDEYESDSSDISY